MKQEQDPELVKKRQKLETAIEQEVFRYVDMVKEHMFDYVMIFLNKNSANGFDVDRMVAARLLEIAKSGVEDGMLSKMDMFKAKLDKSLTEFSDGVQNPLQPTKEQKKRK